MNHYDKLQQAFRATGYVTNGQSHDLAKIAVDTPIDMVLFCPACGLQHIDAPGGNSMPDYDPRYEWTPPWNNPPHRSHLCSCGHQWRPADVPTNGVLAVTTRGTKDSPLVGTSAMTAIPTTSLAWLRKYYPVVCEKAGIKAQV